MRTFEKKILRRELFVSYEEGTYEIERELH